MIVTNVETDLGRQADMAIRLPRDERLFKASAADHGMIIDMHP